MTYLKVHHQFNKIVFQGLSVITASKLSLKYSFVEIRFLGSEKWAIVPLDVDLMNWIQEIMHRVDLSFGDKDTDLLGCS